MSSIVAVGSALPEHYYSQDALAESLHAVWQRRHYNPARIATIHRNVRVKGRHLALPLEHYFELHTFEARNNAFIQGAIELGSQAIRSVFQQAGLGPRDVSHLFFVSVTGIAAPSIDAHLINALGFPQHIKRTPIFGLGCVAGAAGLARAHDYLRAFPDQAVVLLSVELCSLTVQHEDMSIANIVATGLFGDGAAAVVLVGKEHPLAASGARIAATRSTFYYNTERIMGWDVTNTGFKVVLSGEVPRIARENIGRDVEMFLRDRHLDQSEIVSYVCHPGGPKVIDALAEALNLGAAQLEVTTRHLENVGNLSSASVLLVLKETMEHHRPVHGGYGLLIAMGPGFCSELVLLRW